MSTRLKSAIGVSGVILATIVLHYLEILKPIETIIRRPVTLGSGALYNLSASFPEHLSDSPAAAREHSEKLQHTLAEIQLLADENRELREQLRFFSKKKFRYVGAEVIGRNIEPVGNSIVINRGAESGVAEGQAVIASEGVIVGKIARTEPDIAIVRLLNDHQSKLAATLLNGDRSLGIVEGGYGLSVRMSFIPQNETVRVGETVVTSGLESDIPRGLLIGTIEAVEKEAYQPFQRAVLKPIRPFEKLSLVSVIVGEETANGE